MENNLKYSNFRSFYGSIRSFSRVPRDAKLSENQVKCLYKVLLLYSGCCIHTKVKYCQCILFCHEITNFIAPEIPHPLIFVQNRSHQGINMSDLLSDFK